MKKVSGLITIILIGLIISSCDKKNALLINRRTATPEKVEEIKEKAKAKQKRSVARNRYRLFIMLNIRERNDCQYEVEQRLKRAAKERAEREEQRKQAELL